MEKDQIIKYVDTYRIPTWALSSSGLTEEDQLNIEAFDKKVRHLCPEGCIYDCPEGLDDVSYFTCSPEFGLATNVVDVRLYKIMKNVTLTDADINNKDICDDFDWLGDLIEDEETGGSVHQFLFWNNGCACLLKYQMYNNWFSVEIIDELDGNFDLAYNDIKRKLAECLDSSEELYLDRKEEKNGRKFMCRFYYIMEVVNGEK